MALSVVSTFVVVIILVVVVVDVVPLLLYEFADVIIIGARISSIATYAVVSDPSEALTFNQSAVYSNLQ